MTTEKQILEQSSAIALKTLKLTERGFFRPEFVITDDAYSPATGPIEYIVKCGLHHSKILTKSEQLIVELHKKDSIKNACHSLSFSLDYFNQKLKYMSANMELPGCFTFSYKLRVNLESYENGSRQLEWRKKSILSRTFCLIDTSNPDLIIAEFKRSWKFRVVGKLRLYQLLDNTDLAIAALGISNVMYRILVAERSSHGS